MNYDFSGLGSPHLGHRLLQLQTFFLQLGQYQAIVPPTDNNHDQQICILDTE